MALKRVRVIVHGTVQGVYFRSYAQAEGQKLKLAGWVQNRSDGTVELAIEGETGQINKMIHWLHEGSPGSKVTKLQITEERVYGETGVFNIRY